jgi:hypothetical protein
MQIAWVSRTMMQPTEGDNAEVISALITRQREPFALRHPRFVASIWFGCLGALSCIVVVFIVSRLLGLEYWASQFGLLYFLCALMAGSVQGAVILQKPGINGKGAVGAAAKVVLMSHLCIGVLPAMALFASSIFLGASQLWNVPWALLFVPLASLLAGGLVTFPLGCFGGWLFYKYRLRLEGPRGCTLHGYRE